MSSAHPNPWRLAKLLEKSTAMIEAIAANFASAEFSRFPSAALMADRLAEQAAHNRRAIDEEWPAAAQLVEMLDKEAN